MVARRFLVPFYRPARRRPTLLEVLEGYELTARAERKSPKTIEWVTFTTVRFARFLTDRGLPTTVDAVGPEEVRFFIRHLQTALRYQDHPTTKTQPTALSAHAVNSYTRALSSLFTWLGNEGLIEANPFGKVRIPKVPKKVQVVLSVEELALLERAIAAHSRFPLRDRALLYCYLDLMVRLSELADLQVDEMDLKQRRVVVMGKGAKERGLTTGSRLVTLLWEYIRLERPAPRDPLDDRLFLAADGRPLAKRRIQKLLTQWTLWAGIAPRRVHPHVLRRTGATLFIENGGGLPELQRILGHEDLTTTEGYIVLGADHLRQEQQLHSPGDVLARSQRPGYGHRWPRF
jgi:site-specific recombinase XerD